MSIIQGTSKGSGAVYEIDQSIRFNKTDSAILSRTPSSTSNQKTYTISFWFKIGQVGHESPFFIAGDFPGGSSPLFSGILLSNAVAGSPSIMFAEYPGGAAYTFQVATNAVFKDPSAWYHFIAEVDTTQATASNRIKLYVNGELQTDLRASNYPSLNYDTYINSSSYVHRIGRYGTTSFYADGYMAEINFIDGTALDPTSFGETNNDGVWIPKAYSGSYGTNGFYITGETAGDLGEDFSGNGNDFTSSGLTTADQMLDTPTLNYPTLNSAVIYQSGLLLSDGNLDAFGSSGSHWNLIPATMQVPSTGKWAFECTILSSAGYIMIGFGAAKGINNFQGSEKYFDLMQNAGVLYNTETNKYVNGVGTNSGGLAGLTTNDVVECMIDNDAGTMTFLKNGSAYASLSGLNPLEQPAIGVYTNGAYRAKVDFGQIDYVPSDSSYSAINSSTLPTPSITDGSAHFQPTLYTGNGSALEVNQAGNSTFQPDWLWVKSRSLGAGGNHVSYDAVRGVTKEIYPNLTNAEGTSSALTSFDADGFTLLGAASGSERFNASGATYVGWQWKANGAGSSNTDGTITSTASANTTAGFSIVKYAGNLSATGSATIGHGLGIAPSVVISKSMDSTAGDSGAWAVQHTSLAASNILRLNTTAATSSKAGNGTLSSPTSTVFYTNYTEGLNVTGNNYIAYCFAEISGYSSFGSYTGNGNADGPFVYTGFTPRYVLFKRTNAAESWPILDTARGSSFGADAGTGGDNPTAANDLNAVLVASTSSAEEDNSSGSRKASFNSNGFKVRTTNTAMNGSGSTYIYMAFAENPFGGDGVAPATAR